MIDGVKLIELNPIKDDRGWLMEIFRVSITGLQVKQVYLSVVKEGIVKDKDKFHCHKMKWDMLCCIKGTIKVVLIDSRKGSNTKDKMMEIITGEENPKLIIIPPGILHAFKGLKGDGYVIDCETEEFNKENPDEIKTDNTHYNWDQ
ncbi:MAG: dTDP-4-dehydrorhamnose 3,5-epimerase family protein [Sediminibacterium sp.]|nr:dTDP-4-dehydrorhamnose 3,5-epimerase family protein [Sediminibacterium sp.]